MKDIAREEGREHKRRLRSVKKEEEIKEEGEGEEVLKKEG